MGFHDKLVERFAKTPNKLFMLDGIGAVVSALFLGMILPNTENIFGFPKSVLYLLSGFPICFAFYDLFAYYLLNDKYHLFLRFIASANIAYCIISIGVAFNHQDKILIPGWLYLIGEIIIVTLLVSIELKTAKKLVSA